MKLTCSYDALVSCLADMAVVVEDAMSAEDMKNIIFRTTKTGKVELVGINQLITFNRDLTNGEYRVEAEESEFDEHGLAYMQVKSKEVITFLNTFKGLRRTKVTDVILETVTRYVKATVLEEDLESGKALSSHWLLDNIPIKKNIHPQLSLSMPEEGVSLLETQLILFYTANLLPIMQNGTSLFGKLVFGEDKVVAFNSGFTTLVKNLLPDSFKGLSLSYRAIAFMKSVICNEPNVQVARTERHICFKTSNSEAFIIYESRIADYRIYVDMFKNDHAITLDRQYFKDVLKRLSLGSDTVEFKITPETNCIEVKNSKFGQEIPILSTKNMEDLGEINFKILPDILSKTIIGDDLQFSPVTFLYIVPNTNGSYALIFADDSGQWYSTVSVH